MNLENLPAWEKVRTAQQQEEDLRDLAFLDVTLDICGVEVRQLTPQHLLTLFFSRSPFLSGGPRGPEHVAQFLWIVSPRYTGSDRAAAAAFTAEIAASVPHDTACAEIETYLDHALMDRPATSGAPRKRITSIIASLCDVFAEAYGWDDAHVLEKPIARLYQYLRRIELRRDRNAVFINPLSDRAKAEVLQALPPSARKRRAQP